MNRRTFGQDLFSAYVTAAFRSIVLLAIGSHAAAASAETAMIVAAYAVAVLTVLPATCAHSRNELDERFDRPSSGHPDA